MSERNRLKKPPENRKSEHSIFKCLIGRIFLKLCCLELETKKKDDFSRATSGMKLNGLLQLSVKQF